MTRTWHSIALLAVVVVGSVFIAGCRTTQERWKNARGMARVDSPEASAAPSSRNDTHGDTATVSEGIAHSGLDPNTGVRGTLVAASFPRKDSLSHYLRPASFSFSEMAEDGETGLTLQEVEGIALQLHPAIRQQQARVTAARGQRTQAGLPFNPVLQYQSEEVGNEQASGLHSVAISQQIVTADKLRLAEQVACHEVQKQLSRLKMEELRVLARVRQAFNRALVARQRTRLTAQILNVAEESISAVEDLVDAEEASRLALLQTRVQAEQTRIDSDNAQTNYLASMRGLAAAVGDPSIETQSLSGDLATSLDDRPWETLVQELVASSPEMSLAGSELQRARWALQLACGQVVPNVTGQAGVGYDAATDDTFATFGVSVPLPIRNRNQGNIQSARASIVAASNEMDATRLSLESRLAAAVGRYEVARDRHMRLATTVVPAAEEAYALASLAFEEGEADYLQLLTAQRALFNTRLSVLNALENANAAAAEIDTSLVSLPF
ncbi:MAG: TolC family protein [Planctomycetota bacterium]